MAGGSPKTAPRLLLFTFHLLLSDGINKCKAITRSNRFIRLIFFYLISDSNYVLLINSLCVRVCVCVSDDKLLPWVPFRQR